MASNVLLFSLFLNFIFSINAMDMQFQTTDKTFAYYMNSKLFQNLKQKLAIPAMYVYDYGFFIGNLDKIGITTSDGDLGIKITKKDGTTVESQARCTETAYITEGYNYVLLCDAKQEFVSLTISPSDSTDTIAIDGYQNIKFTVDDEDNYSTIIKGRNILLIFALLLMI